MRVGMICCDAWGCCRIELFTCVGLQAYRPLPRWANGEWQKRNSTTCAMRPERWQQLDGLFHAALERAPEERAAFLNEACGRNESVRKQVDALLAAPEKAGSSSSDRQWKLRRVPSQLIKMSWLRDGTVGHYKIAVAGKPFLRGVICSYTQHQAVLAFISDLPSR